MPKAKKMLKDYSDFPKAIEDHMSKFFNYKAVYRCPSCTSLDYKKSTIQTKQGQKPIRICIKCKTKFRLKN